MQIHLASNRDTEDVDAELPAPVTPVLDFSGRVVRGRYRLRTWNRRLPPATQIVDVGAGPPVTAELTVAAGAAR